MTSVTTAPVRLNYKKIRDVTTDDESNNGSMTYVVVASSAEILKLGTAGNLRDYLPAHPGKKRTTVHKEIGQTIRNYPDRFSQLNSGFVIGTSQIKIDDQKREVLLWDASVNNGAQSQGEIDLYFRECEESEKTPTPFDIRIELSVEPKSEMRTEIAIARNSATPVKDISQAGKRGYFNDLSEHFQKQHQNLKLATSEAHVGEEYVNTRLLLQVLWALMPNELLPKGRSPLQSRVKAYVNPAQCLSDFEQVWEKRDKDPEDSVRYKYFCDMVGSAWEQYHTWQTHESWSGLYLKEKAKQVKRKNGVVLAADGLIFPILSAMSNFVKFDTASNRWEIRKPTLFKDERILDAARRQLSAHSGKPMLMGRSSAAYEALCILTEMATEMASDFDQTNSAA